MRWGRQVKEQELAVMGSNEIQQYRNELEAHRRLREERQSMSVQVAPEYLASEIKQLNDKSTWLKGELDLWRERMREAELAIRQLEQIETQVEASLRQLDPPPAPPDQLSQQMEKDLEEVLNGDEPQAEPSK